MRNFGPYAHRFVECILLTMSRVVGRGLTALVDYSWWWDESFLKEILKYRKVNCCIVDVNFT